MPAPGREQRMSTYPSHLPGPRIATLSEFRTDICRKTGAKACRTPTMMTGVACVASRRIPGDVGGVTELPADLSSSIEPSWHICHALSRGQLFRRINGDYRNP